MHDDFERLMSLVLDGESTPSEEHQLDAHLCSCTACASVWRRYQELDRQLSASPAVRPPEGFAQGVVDRVEGRQADG